MTMKNCPNCAQPLEDDVTICTRCNANLALGVASGPPQTSGMAIGSMVCGFLSLLWPAAVAAIILGHISRSQIKKSGGHLTGSGMALTGLIFGYLGVSLIPILIIAAIAIPNLLRARIAANEASSVGSLRTLNTAAYYYQDKYGQFPPALAALAPPPAGTAVGPMNADLIDSVLGSGRKSGYLFHYAAVDSDGDGTFDGYEIYADPVTAGTTGQRHFFTDQTGVIRMESDKPASGESPPIM
jgi:hypothetical protein